GVEVTNQYVHSFGEVVKDPETGKYFAVRDRFPTLVAATSAAEAHSLLARKFATEVFALNTVRLVRPAGAKGGPFQAEVFLEVVPSSRHQQEFIWAEEASALRDPNKHNVNIIRSEQLLARRTEKPLPVAVTVSEGSESPRMVVIGDAEFITDESLTRRRTV